MESTTDFRAVRAEPVERDPKQTLTGHEIEAELLADWRIMFATLQARFRTGDFATGLRLVQEIGAAAEEMNHHPDLDLRYPTVHVRLSSHDVGGLTQRDVDLARRISQAAGRLGAKADTDAVQVLEIALDAADAARSSPFWAAVLGLTATRRGRRGQRRQRHPAEPVVPGTEAHDEAPRPQQRFHLDIRVPPEVAERRVKDALEAGGTLVSDGRAPSFWVLADADGNKACVTTWLGRAVSPDEVDDRTDRRRQRARPRGTRRRPEPAPNSGRAPPGCWDRRPACWDGPEVD